MHSSLWPGEGGWVGGMAGGPGQSVCDSVTWNTLHSRLWSLNYRILRTGTSCLDAKEPADWLNRTSSDYLNCQMFFSVNVVGCVPEAGTSNNRRMISCLNALEYKMYFRGGGEPLQYHDRPLQTRACM